MAEEEERDLEYEAYDVGVIKEVLKPGNGVDRPKKGDNVAMEYTGWLYDSSIPGDHRGAQFDSSVGRGDFKTQIGTGQVIKGWDDGIIGNAQTEAMTLGEKAILTISGHFAYGSVGFPGLIPPNATLIFEVTLKAINDKTA